VSVKPGPQLQPTKRFDVQLSATKIERIRTEQLRSALVVKGRLAIDFSQQAFSISTRPNPFLIQRSRERSRFSKQLAMYLSDHVCVNFRLAVISEQAIYFLLDIR